MFIEYKHGRSLRFTLSKWSKCKMIKICLVCVKRNKAGVWECFNSHNTKVDIVISHEDDNKLGRK